MDTKLGMKQEGQRIVVNGGECLTSSLRITGPADGSRVPLEPLTVPPGKTANFFALYSTGDAIVLEPTTVAVAAACRDRAVEFWEHEAGVPFGASRCRTPGFSPRRRRIPARSGGDRRGSPRCER